MDDYARANRDAWQHYASEFVEAAETNFAGNPRWGVWGYPDADVGLLPDDLTGVDCIEIGCGAGYVSAWLARRGGRVTGVDPTPNQLATARRLREKHKLNFDLVEGYGEQLPFADLSFDFAISEYGAALWADPFRWVPEAARVLRPGGRLVFLTNSVLQTICAHDDDTPGMSQKLERPYLGMYRINYADVPDETEFHLPHGTMIELLTGQGFRIDRLVELGAPAGATSRYAWADAEWARQWPTEEAWVATLTA